MNIIIAVFLSTFAVTAHTKVLNFTLPWKGKIVNGIDDVIQDSLIASIRNIEQHIPIFSAVIISGHHLLSAASCTSDYKDETDLGRIYGLIGNEHYNVKYIEPHPRFKPSHSDFDISLITVKRVTRVRHMKKLPPEIPDEYICKNVAPKDVNYFRIDDNFVFRAFLNFPFLHFRHQALIVKIIPFEYGLSEEESRKYYKNRAFAVSPLNDMASFEKEDLGGGIFHNDQLIGILTRLPNSTGKKGYIFTAIGDSGISSFINAAKRRGMVLIKPLLKAEDAQSNSSNCM